MYIYQAQSFLKGQVDIDPDQYEAVRYKQRSYMMFPPLPAILLTPIVFFAGVSVNVIYISTIFLVVSIFVLRNILQTLQIDQKSIPWILVAFFVGTGYWFCFAWSSGVWQFSHIVGITAMLLAIRQALSNRNAWLVGFYLGLAFLTRQLFIYSAIFLLVVIWKKDHQDRQAKVFDTVRFLSALAICVSGYLLWNWIRFDNVLDTGYSHMSIGTDYGGQRIIQYGLFHPIYIPFNFYSYFIQGVHVNFAPPMLLKPVSMDPFGTSLPAASPFIFFALAAKWKKPFLLSAWTSIFCALIHMMCYHTNGLVQINTMRYTLDFFPILILLVALGTNEIRNNWWKATVVYSVLLNVLAMVALPMVQLSR